MLLDDFALLSALTQSFGLAIVRVDAGALLANNAVGLGGGVSAFFGGWVQIENSAVIAHNFGSGGGGVYAFENSTVTVHSALFEVPCVCE